jgi:Na+/H+ antiporter NhaD/arsenite permease-like protein
MIPALEILNVRGHEIGIDREAPWHFFWASGILSSFLDNAPTYLTFASVAAGMENLSTEGRYLAELLNKGDTAVAMLAAISCGSVFMGANTYIGNGPNFMVKAIAEENGVKMPSFFGYMAYSVGILIPIFILVTFVFFHG